MRSKDRLLVAGSLTLGEVLGLSTLILLGRATTRYPTVDLEGLGLVVALGVAFVVPVAALRAARRLVSEQRSYDPAYLVMFVNLVFAYYDMATEDSRLMAPIVACIAVFVVAFLGTYVGPQGQNNS